MKCHPSFSKFAKNFFIGILSYDYDVVFISTYCYFVLCSLSETSKSQKGSKKADKSVKKVEKKPPSGVYDYDQEQLKDLFSASVYAMDIFDYLKRREVMYAKCLLDCTGRC